MQFSVRFVILLSFVISTFACKSVIRALFYPPEVEMQSGLGPDAPGNSFNHSAFSDLLVKHVDAKGFVNYAGFKKDEKHFNAYLQSLAKKRSVILSRYEELALYINAYNALTIRLILDHPTITSIRDIPANQRWKGRTWFVAGEPLTLDDIEHKIIRARFKENRAHFALVCASVGCPPLRNEAYAGARLLSQLDDQARRFFVEPRNFSWEAEKQTVWLSAILDWYAGDFGGAGQLLEYSKKYVGRNVAAQIDVTQNKAAIRFTAYDWRLNVWSR